MMMPPASYNRSYDCPSTMEEFSPPAKRLRSVLQLTTAWISGFLVKKTQKHRIVRHSIEKFLNSPAKSRAFYHIRKRNKSRMPLATQEIIPNTPPTFRTSLPSQEEYYKQSKKAVKRLRPKRVRKRRNQARAKEHQLVVHNYTSILRNLKKANPIYGRKEDITRHSTSYYGDVNFSKSYAIDRAGLQIQLHKYNYYTFKRLRKEGARRLTSLQIAECATPKEVRAATVHLKSLLSDIDYEKAISSSPSDTRIMWGRMAPVINHSYGNVRSMSYQLPSEKELQEEREMFKQNKARAVAQSSVCTAPPPRLYKSETERQAAKRARSKINKNI